MDKRAQSAVEFMIMVGAAVIFLIGFLVALQYNIRDETDENRAIVTQEIAFTVADEINLAHDSTDGYFRQFRIPLRVLNSEYDINLTEGYVYVRTTNNRFTALVPTVPTMGEVYKGENEIRRENGKVCLNVPLDACNACGDGELDVGFTESYPDELCDTDVFISPNCQTYLGGSIDHGDLICRIDCTIDTRLCSDCGNGRLEGTEECDDGDEASGDGCSSDCELEGGIFICVTCGQGPTYCSDKAAFEECNDEIDNDCDGYCDFDMSGCVMPSIDRDPECCDATDPHEDDPACF